MSVVEKQKIHYSSFLIISTLPHHSGRSLPQPLASAASEFSNLALDTVTQERAGGSKGDIETKVRVGGACKSVTWLDSMRQRQREKRQRSGVVCFVCVCV